MLEIPKYSFALGDSFAGQVQPQLLAFVHAARQGIDVVPVWSMSRRQRLVAGATPSSIRSEVDAAVESTGWAGRRFIGSGRVGIATVDPLLRCCDWFTLDVAHLPNRTASVTSIGDFVERHSCLIGSVRIEGMDRPLEITPDIFLRTAHHYLPAIEEAGRVYRYIADRVGAGRFVTEIAMDQAGYPRTAEELLLILAMVASEKIPVQAIAPKFPGHFHRGIDFVGNVARFEAELDDVLQVISHGVQALGLPRTLKASLHSGDDKHTLFPAIGRVLAKRDAGIHLRSCATSWLEVVAGLAGAGGAGLELARAIYAGARQRFEPLAAAYQEAVRIHRGSLPTAATVNAWSSDEFLRALRHEPGNPRYNPHLRQLLAIAFNIAARMGKRYLDVLAEHQEAIARNVTANLRDRHLLPAFGGPGASRATASRRGSGTSPLRAARRPAA
jgi:hypothetical protein